MNLKSVSDDDSYDEQESVSKNGVEEGYLFSFGSEQTNNHFFLLAKWAFVITLFCIKGF